MYFDNRFYYNLFITSKIERKKEIFLFLSVKKKLLIPFGQVKSCNFCIVINNERYPKDFQELLTIYGFM